MNPLYEFDDMVDYLEGRMSESDRGAFEQALQTDAELARRLEALKNEVQVNRLLREEYLLEQFAEWEQEERNAPKIPAKSGMVRKIVAYRGWIIPAGIAATLIAIVCAGLFFHWFDAQTPQPAITGAQPEPDTTPNIPSVTLHPGDAADTASAQTAVQKSSAVRNAAFYAALADSAYIDEDFSQALMGADNQSDISNRYARAAGFYTSGQYREALRLLEKPEQNQLEEFLYLRGYTYYHLEQYDKAEADFRAFRNFPVSDRKLDAQWCEVFCMIRQLPASRKRLDTLLTGLQSTPGFYSERVAALQKALKGK